MSTVARKNFRRKRGAEDEEAPETGDQVGEGEDVTIVDKDGRPETEVELLRRMEETRNKQRERLLRVREAGAAAMKDRSSEKAEPEEKWGLQYTGGRGGSSKAHILPGTDHEDKMLEFIQKRLAERKAAQGQAEQAEEDSGDDGGSPTERQAALIRQGNIDQLALETPERAIRLTTEPIEDANRWLTGIQEVQLPIEYKIRNIEDTEHARKEMLLQQTGSGGGGKGSSSSSSSSAPAGAIPANFNANFTHHKRFAVVKSMGVAHAADRAKATPGLADPAAAASTSEGGLKRPLQLATDDEVYARYMKKFKELESNTKRTSVSHAK